MSILKQTPENNKLTSASPIPANLAQEIIDTGSVNVRLAVDLSPRRVALTLLSISIVLVFLSVVGHALQFVFSRDLFVEYVRLFNLGGEKNIPTWYTSILLFINAALLAYITLAQKKTERVYVRYWQALAVIFLFLSIDSVATIHDATIELPLVDLLQPSGFFLFPWVILGWIFVVVFAIFYLKFFFDLPMSSRVLFFAAGVIYIGGALALEMVSAYLMDYHVNNTLLRGGVATVQESMEMAGLILFAYGLLLHIKLYVKNYWPN